MSQNHEAPDSDPGPQEPPGEPASTERLRHALGPHELRCALLALLVPRGSRRALASCQSESPTTPHATELRSQAMAVPGALHLPGQYRVDVPAQLPLPDTDAVVQALHEVAALPWTQRPVLVRDWVGAALEHSPARELSDLSADALRMSCTLLDSPLPPELAGRYIEPHP